MCGVNVTILAYSCEVTASMLSAVDVVITIVSTEFGFNINVRQWAVLVSFCMAVDRHDGADIRPASIPYKIYLSDNLC